MPVIIDFHTHILPGIDDGCVTIEESLEASAILAAQGVRTVVATPHFLPDHFEASPTVIFEAVSRLQEQLRAADIEIEILPGNEIMVHQGLVDRILGGDMVPIGGKGKYILIELPLSEIPWFAMTTLDHAVELGLTPIVAHPERCLPLHKDAAEIRSWFSKGILAQLDIASLMGHHGTEVQRFAVMLIRNHMIHLVGSDLHGPSTRSRLWTEAVKKITKLGGEEYVRTITSILPGAIIRDQEIRLLVPPPRVTRQLSIRRIANAILGNSRQE